MSTDDTQNPFGKTNIDSFEGYKFFKMKTPDKKKGEESTELVLRLMPAMKSSRATGEWRFFYGQHYGYYGNNPRNPEKPRARPFGCIQKKVKNVIETHCPKCDQIESYRKAAKVREEEVLKAAGITDEKSPEAYEAKQADKKYKTLSAWLKSHNCDKKFWMNVMTPNGEFGVLQLSYETTMNVLLPCLKQLRDERKVDPFDPAKGVFLKFTRTGQAPRVKDAIVPYQEAVMVNGEELQRLKYAPLDQDLIAKAVKVLPDLAKDVVKFIPIETIKALVACNGDPDEVDRIWPASEKKVEEKVETKSTGTTDVTDDVSGDETDSAPDVESTEGPAPGVDTKAQAAPAGEDDEEAAALKAYEEAKAKSAAKKAAATKAATQLAGSEADPINDPDRFLANFEAK